MSNNKTRESNFELLRFLAMYFIVFYHLLLFFVVKVDDNVLYKAMYLPLHVAVLCFVLISGYFHIKPSFRGLAKLMTPLLIFYLPLTACGYFIFDMGRVEDFFFFSKSPYWFIRTYLYLFLFAPVLNAFLISTKRRLYLLFTLGFIAVYMGTMHEGALSNGKNLVLFMLLYVIGDLLHIYKEKLSNIKMLPLIVFYIVFNICLVALYSCTPGSIYGKALWRLSYPYCSPILLVNALLFFLIFSKIKLKSTVVNYLSGSVFTIYVLHHHPLVLEKVLSPMVMGAYAQFSYSSILVLSLLACITFVVMFASIGIDKLFSPFISYVVDFASKIDEKAHFKLQ